MLVQKEGSNITWDGQKFGNLTGKVGVASGTRIMIDRVKEVGGTVDDGGKSDKQNISKLLEGHIDLMAGYELDLVPIIDSSFKGKVKMLPVPLIETYYYLAFSKVFYNKNKDFAEAIWGKLKPQK